MYPMRVEGIIIPSFISSEAFASLAFQSLSVKLPLSFPAGASPFVIIFVSSCNGALKKDRNR